MLDKSPAGNAISERSSPRSGNSQDEAEQNDSSDDLVSSMKCASDYSSTLKDIEVQMTLKKSLNDKMKEAGFTGKLSILSNLIMRNSDMNKTIKEDSIKKKELPDNPPKQKTEDQKDNKGLQKITRQ